MKGTNIDCAGNMCYDNKTKSRKESVRLGEKKSDGVTYGTPYDDVFKTLLNDCSSLIIPIINETFGEHYTGDEQVVLGPSEHFLAMEGGETEKRISDSSFTIIGEKPQRYLYECQSTADNSMSVRIFEYAAQIAVEQSEVVGHTLKVKIPQSAVLFLRSTKNTPDRMRVEMTTPGGTVDFDIPVVRIQTYSLGGIFEKNLLFLIPFYIFTHESRFSEYNTDEEKLETLKTEYIRIMEHLDLLARDGRISEYIKKTLIEMSRKVLDNIARKYDNVREGVRKVMGGRVLDYEAKTILNEGRAKERQSTVIKLWNKNMPLSDIADVVAQPIETVVEILTSAGYHVAK